MNWIIYQNVKRVRYGFSLRYFNQFVCLVVLNVLFLAEGEGGDANGKKEKVEDVEAAAPAEGAAEPAS